MKYRELIQFEPITSVIKLVETDKKSVQEGIVSSFVFSKNMVELLPTIFTQNLVFERTDSQEQKGIQVVGSYGTGKSHLMALVAAIAEDESLLPLIHEESIKSSFSSFAGKYKILRFEVGTDKPFKDILFSQIERFLSQNNVNFSFNAESNFSWKEQLEDMMAAFESVYPDKGLLIVIDELLEYLKGRDPRVINNDLSLLRQAGELCDGSRFKIMYGVQELLYRSPELQFAAEALNHTQDRYSDILITREDVAFVVKERLLKKTVHQKQKIRDHLLQFSPLYDGINTNLNEYVDLFPVHPTYVLQFERIKHGKSQREILKALSTRFEAIKELDVPTDKPGLITYDTYFQELLQNSSMLSIPDIRNVREKVEIINDRINNHFVQGRASRKALAQQVTNALAIKVLSDDLDKHCGATAYSLKEDLCIAIPGVDDPELLTQAVESVASQLKTATAGQYIDQETVSNDFYIRTEGGINIAQLVRDYADTVLKRNSMQADQYFFQFLQFILGIQQDPYRVGFQIWSHELEWIEKKSFRLGYIFFGNPNERSTTEPIQQFYMFFSPLYSVLERNDEEDEIYFDFTGMSESFKDRIFLLGAAKAKHSDASSDQKKLFKNQIEEHQKRAIELFEKEFVDRVTILYKGKETKLKTYSLPPEGTSKEAIFSFVASRVLNNHFTEKNPEYPAFKDLLVSNSKDNFEVRIKSALRKLVNFTQPNRDGEAILAGLGLLGNQSIDVQNSRYADSILKKLKVRGDGKVLNRDDILYPHYLPSNLWYSVDYQLEYQLEFVILAALVYKGEIEIKWNSKTLTAPNFDQTILSLDNNDFFTFQTIQKPIGTNFKSLKALFNYLNLPDLSAELDKPETLTQIITTASDRVKKVVSLKAKIYQGITCRTISLISTEKTALYCGLLDKLASLLDEIQSYNSYGKLRNFNYSEAELKEAFEAWPLCDEIEKLISRAAKFEELISYLTQAQSYVLESEKPLYDDIDNEIQRLSLVLLSNNDNELKKYETKLLSLKDSYADYYLSQYLKCRLSHSDSLKKEQILSSNKKKICDVIKDVDILNKAEYENWINLIMSLKPAKHDISKPLIKENPYHDFNPREFYNKPSYSIRDLENQLDEILDKWTKAMRSIFRDPSIQANIEMLDDESKVLATSFKDGSEILTNLNAPKIRNLIAELSKGFERIELDPKDFLTVFTKPMTVNEAHEAFNTYLDSLCKGKERSKIRIILSEKK